MPSKRRSARRTGKGLDKREITLPPRAYQPSKAETAREYDMPALDIMTVRNAFFRRVRVKEGKPETDD